MTTTHISAALAQFDTDIAIATTPDAIYKAIEVLTRAVVDAKLFTVMTVDMEAGLARRAYSSDVVSYPVSGTKPITYDDWFDIVHKERRYFVANSISEIADLFPDYALIDSLGCQSVVNVPVILGDDLVATVNLLDVEGYYTPERVKLIEEHLSIPYKLACAVAEKI